MPSFVENLHLHFVFSPALLALELNFLRSSRAVLWIGGLSMYGGLGFRAVSGR